MNIFSRFAGGCANVVEKLAAQLTAQAAQI
jgi:hypothetical protein